MAGTAALIAIGVLAMTGSVLSRAHKSEGARGGTLTVVSLKGSPDVDPARINDVYETMIARALDRTPYSACGPAAGCRRACRPPFRRFGAPP